MATKRRKKKRLHKGKFLRFIIILLMLIGGIISLFLYAPIFDIKEVAVAGNDAVSSEEIINSSGIVIGTNIFKMDKDDVELNVKNISRIDTVKVKRKSPKRVSVTVTETYPQIIIPYMSGFIVANEYGKVIELCDDISGYTLPVLSGIEVSEAKICEKIVVEDEITFDIIVDCLLLLKEKEALPIFKSIDFSNITNLNGYTHEGVKIIFGKMTDLEYKLKVLNDVMGKVDKTEGAYIDLSTPSATVYGIYQEPEPVEEETEEQTEEATDVQENETGESASAE